MPELAPVIAAAAVVAGMVALVTTRQPLPSLRVALDLLLAAGLLRLAGEPRPQALAAAAGVIVVRRLAGTALRSAARAARSGT